METKETNKKEVGFFEESPNVKSMTRLKSFFAFVGAFLISGYAVFTGSIEEHIWLIGTFLAYSGGEKIAQKVQERKAKE